MIARLFRRRRRPKVVDPNRYDNLYLPTSKSMTWPDRSAVWWVIYHDLCDYVGYELPHMTPHMFVQYEKRAAWIVQFVRAIRRGKESLAQTASRDAKEGR